VNGYLPKFWGLFLVPLISAGLFLLFIAIPKIDSLKHNIEKFRKYYEGFVVLIFVFLFYVHLLAPDFGLLYYYCGILI